MSRRFYLVTAAALLCGAAAGCLDAIAPGHGGARGASFGLIPVFEGATSGGIPGDVDLIRLTIHDPPTPDTTIDRSVAPGQDSITLTIPIALNGARDLVVVQFQALRSSDNTVLYSGTDTVPVSAGQATSAPIVAAYVGPGKNILSIAIVPSAAILQPGDTLSFQFRAVDSAGDSIVGMPGLFASRAPAVMSVAASGLAKAIDTGSTYIVVTSGARSSIKDSARVTVTRGAQGIASLALQPGFAMVQVGANVTLAVTAKDANGTTVPATGVTFVSRTPGVASVGATGLVSGAAAGTAVIVASAGSAADSMLVAVAASGSAVVSALDSGRAFAQAKVGDTVSVLVMADLRAVPGQLLGSYNALLVWNTATLRYVASDTVSGGFAAPTINQNLVASGELPFGSADPNGTAGQVVLLQIKFVAAASGTSPISIGLSDLSAAKTFTQLLPAATLVSGTVTVR